MIVIRSYYRGDESEPSNYGHASSHSDRCELLIDNQAVSVNYESYIEKQSCDREIIRACEALNVQKWPEDR